MKRFTIRIIKLYQLLLSPDKSFLRFLPLQSGHCMMYPTCSDYMIQSIDKFGVLQGILKGIRRILRCHPWQKNLVDIP